MPPDTDTVMIFMFGGGLLVGILFGVLLSMRGMNAEVGTCANCGVDTDPNRDPVSRH